ncbi:MAG: phosphatase PAP2 family protein, partial [Chryseobacterium sp.]
LLSIFVSFFPESVIDREFSEEVQEHRYPLLDTAMKIISVPGYVEVSPIIVLIVAAVFWLYKYKREAGFTILTLLAGAVSSVFKMFINRPRPHQDLVRIIEKTRQQSFPSGHTLFYVVFFGFMIEHYKNTFYHDDGSIDDDSEIYSSEGK